MAKLCSQVMDALLVNVVAEAVALMQMNEPSGRIEVATRYSHVQRGVSWVRKL